MTNMRIARIATFGIIALAAFHVTTGRATAQFIGPYSGYGYGGFGGYGFGGFGGYGYGGFGPRYGGGYFGYPGAFGSFWTNGRSLYGPPVATGAPVPGSFGGSDASYNTSSPGSYSPFFWNGTLGVAGASRDFPPLAPANYNGPRFATRDVKRRYAQDKANPQSAIDRAYRDAGRMNPR